MRNVEAVILNAIENKERIIIAYHGGKEPGTLREIGPIGFDESTGDLRARCYNTNRVKKFRIDKIQVDNLESCKTRTAERPVKPMEFKTLEDAYTHIKDTLDSFGWSVIFSAEERYLELFERFKNGNLKKLPTISITYEEWVIGESSYNLETGVFSEHKVEKKKPWTIRAKKKTTTSYLDLGKTIARFLEHAESLAPTKTDVKVRPS